MDSTSWLLSIWISIKSYLIGPADQTPVILFWQYDTDLFPRDWLLSRMTVAEIILT